MIEVKGKYNSAGIFADIVDQASIAQVITLCNQPYTEGSLIRMMPDIQAGAGCTVGTTMTIKDKACPNVVGVDVGCGMEVVLLKEKDIDLQKLDQIIHAEIPSGFDKKTSAHRYIKFTRLNELLCKKHVSMPTVEISLGTLGGGNHFIEVDRDDNGHLYLVIHSGSRILGIKVAAYYQQQAYMQRCGIDRESVEKFIKCLKDAGQHRNIQQELKNLYAKPHPGVIQELAYVDGYLFDAYLHDMEIAQEYAMWNRKAISDTILQDMGLHMEDRFTTIHNYIDMKSMILRKGAVSAQDGEQLIIPMNMRDGSLICRGKGNPDWNYSAPHGAGRLMSRAAAKDAFTVEEYKKQMEGIYTSSVGQGTLDECPMAYKPMDSIISCIEPTVEIETIIRPIYNFKAGNEADVS